MTVHVSDLTVTRGGVAVLEGLSFALRPGEAVVLRGPNGIGKTTLLRTVAGLQPARAGRVEAPPESMVYAGHADGLKATLTVSENLTFWARVFGQGAIGPALDAFELCPLADRQAGALSAGQKRRLGLARLLVTGRPVWLLDEPTVSLDVDAVALFADAVRAHLAGGGSALMATHIDLGLAEARVLDVAAFRAAAPDAEDFDEVFL
ncbi:heme ABC exporter ATP-binding protein CcmA [Roseovarius salinarum]|uniref:heme ABC exporter ATP-binding protein CcmA n=1 Tax=Roseovarius salinarum TaxID=1981892 RepID=UPI000C322765|nr:heme ABC exporter ATP-binding protein CcmA [Roseovarius salinarum]